MQQGVLACLQPPELGLGVEQWHTQHLRCLPVPGHWMSKALEHVLQHQRVSAMSDIWGCQCMGVSFHV